MLLSFITGSIRRTLIALVFASLLPALGIIVYSAFMDRHHAHDEARLSALRLALAMAEMQERNTGTIRQLLDLLGDMPPVRSGLAQETTPLLKKLANDNPMLADIYVTDLDGTFRASATAPAGTNITDRPYFREALARGRYTAGKFQIGRSSSLPVFPFAAPLRGPSGEVRGIIAASISLEGYAALFDKSSLPPDSVFTLADRDGVRLFRFPLENSAQPGQPLPSDLWNMISGRETPGTAVFTGADGVRRIYAFAQLRLSREEPPYMHVVVGIPESQALAAANDALGRNLLLLALATVLALCISWTLWKPVAGRRIDRLVAVTRRLGEGDLSTRVETASPSGELGTLERSVNAMAQAMADSARTQSRYEQALKAAHGELEQRVEDRTRELMEANRRLKSEMFERERAELALRASESKYRSLYENAAAGILILDVQGRILDANPAALTLLGYVPEGLRGRPYREIIHPDNLEALPLRLDSLTEGNSVRAERLLLSGRGKHVPVDVACSQMAGGMLQVVFTDATQRKQFERLRDDVDRILRHDLKTPLMGMAQIPSLMLRDEGITERQRTYLELMRDSAGKMLNTINMSMAIYKMETGQYACEPVPFDLLPTLRRTAGEAAILAEARKLRLSLTLDGAEPAPGVSFPVAGEESLCVTMLENLVKNAMEASPENGIVSLELAARAHTLTIRNQGEVPMDVRGRFFEKYATSGKKWGTGLGTYSARLIATAHGWDIRLDASAPGETSIVIAFPSPPDSRETQGPGPA